MNLPLVVRPEAEADLLAVCDWYESQKAGMGSDFLQEIEAAFRLIVQFPEARAAEFKDVRRTRVKRFPYIVYYRMICDKIEVLAVPHGSRHARLWQARS